MATRRHHQLSALAIAKPNLAAGRYADGNGLHLVVDRSGARRWLLRIVVRGKRTDIGLGGLSKVTLAQARREAEAMRAIAYAGGDPLEERKKRQLGAPTFEEAARTVHREHSPSWKNDKHRQQWINTLNEYVFPHVGNKRVDAVDSADVLKVLGPIWLAKEETARRVRQRIGTILDWAKAAGYRTAENPVHGIERGLPKQARLENHHDSLPHVELPAFIGALRLCRARQSTKLAFEFLILTATRTEDVIGALRTEFDLEKAEWVIPASRIKGKKRTHRVPLTARMIEILEVSFEEDESPYAFAGSRANRPLSNMVFLKVLERMELGVTAHGFRSTFRMWCAEETNFAREVAELALAHVPKDKVESAYMRSDLFAKRRALMTAWTQYATQQSEVFTG